MAKLSANGEEIGRIEGLTCRMALMSNGKILINHGDGWKRWKKVKPELDIRESHARTMERDKVWREQNPCYTEFLKAFHELVSFEHWMLVFGAIELLHNDVDGLWAEMEDLHMGLSFEDLQFLCAKFLAMREETQRRNAAKN